MKALLAVLVLATAVALCAGQAGYKLEGSWKRTVCKCSNPAPAADCDDLWLTDYKIVQYTGAAWVGADPGPPGTRPLGFATRGAEFTLSANLGILAGYDCHGAIGKEMVCETANKTTEFCRVTFECYDGDCVTAIVTQNMRSIMFPIVGFLLALLWLLLSFLKGVSAEMMIMVVAIVIFLLSVFLLITPQVFSALLAMAFAALALASSKSKGGWENKLAIIAGIFVFLAYAGLNSLAVSGTNIFDATMQGFLYEGCFSYFGTDLKSARCAQYLLFTSFLGFLIMMLTPLLVLFLIMSAFKSDK